MKVAISRFVVVAAIAALVVVCGSTAAWAQSCPASPNYTPDFSTNISCLMAVGNANFATSGTTAVLRLTPAANNQVGSAWYKTLQPLQGGFSTSFQFQFSNASNPPADGIAFVIQNSSLTAIGSPPSGGALGYGDHDGNGDPSQGEGIPKSLAIEFDNYHNDWDPTNFVSHVAIQSCGQGPNTSHHNQACSAAGDAPNSTILAPVSANLSGNTVHSVTIVYALACPTCTPVTTSNNLHVILDNVDLYPSGVNVDLASLGLGDGGTAYVGFTAATGGDFETQDILNWTFTPQAQSAPLTINSPALLPFNGGTGNNAYDYNAVLTGGGVTSWTVQVHPKLIDRKACNKLVQQKFPLAQCFVYQNAGGPGVDSPVLFALTCPNSDENGTCGDLSQDFFADLGSNFTFSKAENPGFQFLAATIGPYPGWLKGSGPDGTDPCNFTNSTGAPFVSNQISSFSVVGDPLATTKGKSGGGGSCWVATYGTIGELPPGIKITLSPPSLNYTKNQPVTATYTCSNPTTSQDPVNSPTGPYLTAASCTQASGHQTVPCVFTALPGGGLACTGTVDTSHTSILPQAFTVKALDSAGNVNVNAVLYRVHN